MRIGRIDGGGYVREALRVRVPLHHLVDRTDPVVTRPGPDTPVHTHPADSERGTVVHQRKGGARRVRRVLRLFRYPASESEQPAQRGESNSGTPGMARQRDQHVSHVVLRQMGSSPYFMTGLPH